MKQDTMFYIALGTVLDDVEKANAWAEFATVAETKEEEQRYRRNALKYKAKSIIHFDRVMDRLVKEYSNV